MFDSVGIVIMSESGNSAMYVGIVVIFCFRVNLLVFKGFPQVVGDVEHDALKQVLH